MSWSQKSVRQRLERVGHTAIVAGRAGVQVRRLDTKLTVAQFESWAAVGRALERGHFDPARK